MAWVKHMNNQPFTHFAIFGTMRSGSNLLEQYLGQYERLLPFGELFNKGFIGTPGQQECLGITREQRDQAPEKMLEAILNASAEKIPGYRIFQAHDPRMLKRALDDPNCAKIILSRDPVESFTSLNIATATDQWMISDIAHRKPAKITFDLDDFVEYIRLQQVYYDKIYQALKLSGQPYFEIDYSALGELATINRLVEFIGGCAPKTALEQPIKRQNPQSLADKIINYKDIWQPLGLPQNPKPEAPVIKPSHERGTDLSRIYFCKHRSLAFAPIPAGPDIMVRRWMEFQDGQMPNNGFTHERLNEWLKPRAAPIFFSVLRHPVRCAYSSFMNKVFPTAGGAYHKIRQQLVSQYGLLLPKGNISENTPQAWLEKSGYGLEEHRTGFKQYLVFVAGNLQGKTDIRQDGKWQLQSEILRRYRVLHPISYIFREETLETDLAFLENKLDLAPYPDALPPFEPPFSFALSDVYDTEIESLTQAAYAADYQAFDFENYR